MKKPRLNYRVPHRVRMDLPPCPWCQSRMVRKAGVVNTDTRSYTQYRCGGCLRYFTPATKIPAKLAAPPCGKAELDRNLVLLRRRVEETVRRDDLRREMFQQACLDVLEGRGYCQNVPLDVSKAKTAAWGDKKLVQWQFGSGWDMAEDHA